MTKVNLAFIGGTGLYEMAGLSERNALDINTPFGPTSAPLVIGSIGKTKVVFLPRHGINHALSPTEVPYKANIYALKSLGVERIVSMSAVGSLKIDICPLDVVVPDQIIDRTTSRDTTFFKNGIVGHVNFANPFCPNLSHFLTSTAKKLKKPTHQGGSYVVIEGPQFSTRAETEIYRSWGASIIGMTVLPEAKLAREAEICYATMAFVTDYDSWYRPVEDVNAKMVVSNLKKNGAFAQELMLALSARPLIARDCKCSSALENALMTNYAHVPIPTAKRLSTIIGKYYPKQEEDQEHA